MDRPELPRRHRSWGRLRGGESSGLPRAIVPGHWYPKALANNWLVRNWIQQPRCGAFFNINLGQPGCLTGVFFYLSLDNNPATTSTWLPSPRIRSRIGLSNSTSGSSGAQPAGLRAFGTISSGHQHRSELDQHDNAQRASASMEANWYGTDPMWHQRR